MVRHTRLLRHRAPVGPYKTVLPNSSEIPYTVSKSRTKTGDTARLLPRHPEEVREGDGHRDVDDEKPQACGLDERRRRGDVREEEQPEPEDRDEQHDEKDAEEEEAEGERRPDLPVALAVQGQEP